MDKNKIDDSVEPVSLSESESKQLLAKYEIPVVRETTAHSLEEAVKAAQETGFPVVLKGLGAELLHKTELGIVHLNLADAKAVENAARSIQDAVGDKLEGFLIQPQVKGKREFVASMFRDKQFGSIEFDPGTAEKKGKGRSLDQFRIR